MNFNSSADSLYLSNYCTLCTMQWKIVCALFMSHYNPSICVSETESMFNAGDGFVLAIHFHRCLALAVQKTVCFHHFSIELL